MTWPILLTQPNVPKPLHGINPRTVLGTDWWDETRRAAYAEHGYTCAACGVKSREARYRQYLEGHEFYTNPRPGLHVYTHTVALCHSCHNFIHDGHMEMMVMEGKYTREKCDDIVDHGLSILRAAGLVEKWERRHGVIKDAPWGDYRMEIIGKLYGPSSANYADWEAGAWRNWKP